VLQGTCRTPNGWDTDNFGPGIAHAEHLLDAPLPDLAPALGLRGIERRVVSEGTPLDVLVHQLAPAPRSGVIRALAGMLRVDEEALPQTLDEVGPELAMQVGLDAALRDRLRAAAQAQSPALGAISGATRGRPTRSRAAKTPRPPTPAAIRRRVLDQPVSRRLRAHLATT
jgi:hypothetical protein